MRGRGLFDPQRTPPRRPEGGGRSRKNDDAEQALSVSELTRRIKGVLEPAIGRVLVEGEVSNFRRYASGHSYFTLKDATSQLPCVMWRSAAEKLRFEPEDGMHVLARGRISVYEPRGNYQLLTERMEPVGLGELAAAFEALKAKLEEEGLFDPARKRPLPVYPRRIALVTSPDGAAVRDMLKVIFARWPCMEVVIAPARVQGDGAAREVARAITAVNRAGCAEVMIVGRGGGSLEDLWAFNEEVVARAIAASEIPVVSAVGHEVDFTIADFVADVRAATPSHAGELVAPELDAVLAHLDRLRRALPGALVERVRRAREQLRGLAGSWALRRPHERVEMLRQEVDELQARLVRLARHMLEPSGAKLATLAGRLDSLSPLAVLERGYSVTLGPDGQVLREARQAPVGSQVTTQLKRGRLVTRVEKHLD